jgi:putative membrane protein (TIGR04086 family)
MKKVNDMAISEGGINTWNILKSVAMAYLITLLIFLVLAIILTYTEFPETMLPSAVVITTLISIMLAGTSAARRARTRGWINGGLAGFIYMLILYLISSFTVVDFRIDQYVWAMLISGILAGALGGVVGINLKHR